ncbi:MAG: 50S ribosomal protein L25/general stress protein Ctc [Deltaproteobacteria bacterium]|nr:50S ribosomal protein L25/general stress protein Ctc [Deltaproteobacteria bacterium]
MEQVVLESFIRKPAGKGGARTLRRSGIIPAIFYGPGAEPIPIQVVKSSLEKTLKKQTSENILYQLTIKGNDQEMVKTAMVKELQKNPIDRSILHLDFYEVSLFKEIDVTVGLKITGKAPGVEKGGILQEISRDLEIRCLPTNIPNHIEVDVSALNIGDSLHAEDLKLPEGIRVLSDAHLTLVTVIPPLEEKPAAEEPAAEAEVEVASKKGKAKTEAEG